MPIRCNPYLSFRAGTREAMEFYRSVFGGELSLTTFAEQHASDDPAEQDKVVHAMLEAEHVVLMASDTPASMEWSPPAGISISLSGDAGDDARLRGYWDGLSDGGTVAMPLEPAPWGDTFGLVVDRFGVSWMVNIAGAPS